MRADAQEIHPVSPLPDAFYELSDDARIEAYTALAREALHAWGLASAKLKLLKQRENAVFAVDGDHGQRAVLRIHRAGYHSDEALRSELQWMAALDEFGVATPAVIPADSGAPFVIASVASVPEPRQVDLLAWVDGQPLGTIEDGVGDQGNAEESYRLAGTLIARMHNFAADWPLPEGFQRHAWDEDGLLGEDPFWGRFWELQALSSTQRAIILKARELALTALYNYGQGPDRYGLIHADPLPENFLRDAEGTVRVIDFDDGGFGWLLFDFATALFFYIGEPCFDELLDAMVTGYKQVRELPPEFEKQLPLFLLLRGFSYLGWVHTRENTDLAREVTPMLVEGVSALAEDFITNYAHTQNHHANRA